MKSSRILLALCLSQAVVLTSCESVSTYRDAHRLFEFQYPKDMEFSPNGAENMNVYDETLGREVFVVRAIGTGDERYSDCLEDRSPSMDLPLASYVSVLRTFLTEDAHVDPKDLGTLEATTIDGRPAFTFTITNFSDRCGGLLFDLQKDHLYRVIIAEYNGRKYTIEFEEDSLKAKTILSTFKFLQLKTR